MRLACPRDFYNGPIYTRYPPPDAVYVKRAQLLLSYPAPILIAGCGFGGLVKALLDSGREAWGIDASWWAVGRRVTSRVLYGDILQPLNQLWPTIVTEDLLPHLTDDEAKLAAGNCRLASSNVLHLVTEHGQADLNYHSIEEWMRLTDQPVISLEGM